MSMAHKFQTPQIKSVQIKKNIHYYFICWIWDLVKKVREHSVTFPLHWGWELNSLILYVLCIGSNILYLVKDIVIYDSVYDFCMCACFFLKLSQPQRLQWLNWLRKFWAVAIMDLLMLKRENKLFGIIFFSLCWCLSRMFILMFWFFYL